MDRREEIGQELLPVYQRFIRERHRVWERRQAGAPAPWSEDSVLQRRKFTNVFRVLDPGSQFAVGILNEPGLSRQETFARAFLYRYTNLPSAWDAVRGVLGRYPVLQDMADGTLFQRWARLRDAGVQTFSGAYMILPQPNVSGDKLEQAIQLTVRVANDPDVLLALDSPADAHRAMMKHYGVGSFMAMQVLTDWGYSAHGRDAENEFVAEGPGSKRGAALVLPGVPVVKAIIQLRDMWLDDLLCPLVLARGQYRPPSLMDVQNTLCEFDKYHRYWSGAKALPNLYRPAHPGRQPRPMFPPSWGGGE